VGDEAIVRKLRPIRKHPVTQSGSNGDEEKAIKGLNNGGNNLFLQEIFQNMSSGLRMPLRRGTL